MIKHTLQEGNRVRITTHEGAVHCQYCEKSYLFGETGIVVSVNPNFADIGIKLKGKEIECIEEVDYRCLTRIDRTFEEIIKELSVKLGVPCHIDEEGDVAYLDSEDMLIYDTGQFRADECYLEPDQLAAISKACSEIAENKLHN